MLVLICLLWVGKAEALVSTRHSCKIMISLEKINGEEQNIQFISALKTKDQCKALAHIHRKNFDPSKIRSKKVTFVWKKSTKSIPALAKRSQKISKHYRKAKFKKF